MSTNVSLFLTAEAVIFIILLIVDDIIFFMVLPRVAKTAIYPLGLSRSFC